MFKHKTLYTCCFFVITNLTLLFSSCGRQAPSYPYSLVKADSLLSDRPDRALAVLDAFRDSLPGLSEETAMYYDLLCVKAADRRAVRPLSDSLIAPVIRYYDQRKDTKKQIEAYYYGGRVYAGIQDIPRALAYFQKAIDLSGETEPYDFRAALHKQTGALLVYQERYEEALSAYEKAYNYQLLAKNSFQLFEPLLCMARLYQKTGKKESAVRAYQKADNLAQKAGETPQSAEILSELGRLYVDLKQYEEASACFRLSREKGDGEIPAPTCLGLGHLFLETGRPDSASFYLHKSMEKGDVYVINEAQKYLFRLEDERSNYKDALTYAEQHILSYDSIRKLTTAESARKAHELYNYDRTETENHQLKLANVRKKLFIFEWLLVCLLLVGSGLVFMYRMQRKKDEMIRAERNLRKEKENQYKQSLEYIEANKQKINQLTARLIEAEQQKDNALQASLKAQKELLEIINRHVLAHRKSKECLEKELVNSAIYRKFHESGEEEAMRMEEEDWRLLQQALDQTYENFTNRLYALHPKLSLMELRICYLVKISVSITHMANLLNRSKSAISTARTRLYKKLFGKPGTPDDLDAFIATL